MKQYSVIIFLIATGVATQMQVEVAPLKILGGREALARLQTFQSARTQARAPLFEPTQSQAGKSLQRRKWKSSPPPTALKCGPGVGSCDPGYW